MSENQEKQPARRRRRDGISLYSFAKQSRAFVLLAAFFIQLLFSGMAQEGQVIPFLLRAGVILAAIFMTADRKDHLIIGLVLGVPALVLTGISKSTDNQIVDWIAYFNALLLYLFILRLMLRQIFNAPVITLNTIGLALCTYILIGTIWVLFYLPVVALDPDAFTHPIMNDPNPGHTLTYFSYVTLATLGYGDISPVSVLARNLAILEAVTGTLFLAVLISRLVGSYSARRESGGDRPDQ